jgi:hypothetical protein
MSAMEAVVEAYAPSHPGLFEVDFKEGYYSALIARKVRLSDTMAKLLTNPAVCRTSNLEK